MRKIIISYSNDDKNDDNIGEGEVQCAGVRQSIRNRRNVERLEPQ